MTRLQQLFFREGLDAGVLRCVTPSPLFEVVSETFPTPSKLIRVTDATPKRIFTA